MTAHEIRSEGVWHQPGFTVVRKYRIRCTCGEAVIDRNPRLAHALYEIHVESPGFDDVFPGLADVESPFGERPVTALDELRDELLATSEHRLRRETRDPLAFDWCPICREEFYFVFEAWLDEDGGLFAEAGLRCDGCAP